jgi:hypothetical protein
MIFPILFISYIGVQILNVKLKNLVVFLFL